MYINLCNLKCSYTILYNTKSDYTTLLKTKPLFYVHVLITLEKLRESKHNKL